MNDVDTIIFDLGNTLMSIPATDDEEELTAALLGISVDEVRRVSYRICTNYLGETPSRFLTRLGQWASELLGRECTQELSRLWYRSVESAQLTPYAHEVLDTLRPCMRNMILVSNTTPVSWLILDRLDLRRKFDKIVFSCDVGFLKPDPRIFQRALTDCNADPSRTCVIGDKIRTDILGASILEVRSTILLDVECEFTMIDRRLPVTAVVPSIVEIPPIFGLSIPGL